MRAICILCLASLGVLLPEAPARAQEERLVLAFYYAWYDDNTWTYDKVPDMPVSTYRSADRATIERQVGEAQGAGIDAFVQSWYGPGDNPTEQNLNTLLDVAQARGFQATLDFECGSPFMPHIDAVLNGLRHLVGVHAARPAFLRYGDRPVIFFWQQGRYSLEQWAWLRGQVDPAHRTIWIADGDNAAWLDVFDGLHFYNITWRVNTNPSYTATKMRKRVDEYNAAHGTGRIWVATAMPGYDDTHVQGRANPYTYGRSPEYYRSTWQAAMASTPEMVIVTSYNEWCEGTMIEPSVTYGRTYLDLTAELAAQYKSASPPGARAVAPTATPVPSTATPVPTLTPTPLPTSTNTPTATATSTSTPAPTATPSSTPSPTATPTTTATATATSTLTLTATATATATRTAAPTAAATLERTFAEVAAYNNMERSSAVALDPDSSPITALVLGGCILLAGGAGWAIARRGRRQGNP